MNLDGFLRRLDEAQAQHAKEALRRPSQRDEFEYGRMCGIYAGLERAKQLVEDMLAEQERKGANL